jgi:hypothetical protein
VALARTVVGIFSKMNAGTPAFTTEAFTPPANSLLVVRVYLMRNSGESEMGQPSISGGGLTWTARPTATTTLKPSWSTKAVWFTAPVGSSPSSMTITVDDANNLNIYEYVVSVLAYTGYDVTTPIGGMLGSGTTNIGDGEESRTLSEAPAAGDETLLCIDADATKGPPSPSLDTGWTLVHEKSASGESGIAIASRTGSTSTTVKVKDSYNVSGGSFSKAGMGALVVRAETANLLSLELTDSVGISDALTKGAGKGLADGVSVSDGVAKSTARPVDDSVAIADTVAKAPGKRLADQVGVADVLAKGTAKAAADEVPIADQVVKQSAKGLADQVEISDTFSKKIGRQLADAFGIADALVRRVGKAAADVVGISDLLESKLFKRSPDVELPTTASLVGAHARLTLLDATVGVAVIGTASSVAVEPYAATVELVASATAADVDPLQTNPSILDHRAEVTIDG